MLYRYYVVAEGPRPESYREDVESAMHIEDCKLLKCGSVDLNYCNGKRSDCLMVTFLLFSG